MCLAIVQPKGKRTPIEHLHKGWIANPDGGGYAFIHENKVAIRKGFGKLKEMLASYNADLHAHPDSPFLIHFRITSMGESTAEYTHPFPIEGGALIHNGTMTGTGAVWDKGPSDTKIFVDRFGKNLSFDIIQANRPEWDEALRGNKIATLYDDGRYQIVNEQDGHWDNEVWYSNTSYKSFWAMGNVTGSDDWE